MWPPTTIICIYHHLSIHLQKISFNFDSCEQNCYIHQGTDFCIEHTSAFLGNQGMQLLDHLTIIISKQFRHH